MCNKTFRLFISSTFNDFQRERDRLQTEVFPEIEIYAQEKGYNFQPIDLRWGVNEEAQLDQKTLALCLGEVQTCKTHLHPNFLIMAGDRYGWTPLPYAIEQNEFETLLALIDPKDQEVLLEWYKKDLNQLPASYIIKERSGNFVDHEEWDKVEEKLRRILQTAVDIAELPEEDKSKYILSATEAEVLEGIFPYLKHTPFQTSLLKKSPDLGNTDTQHIFGFLRDIDIESRQSDKFINGASEKTEGKSDYEKAQGFKARIKEVLPENVLQVKTTQKDKESLNEAYLDEFEEKIKTFLLGQIDSQKEQDEQSSQLLKEQQAQTYFAQQKRQDFIGQEATLASIREYLGNDDTRPLIIHGPSGSGKSAIMAHAIKETTSDNRKILYRFIGATPNTSSSKEILTSLFAELKSIRNENEKNGKPGTLLDEIKKEESFEDFSYRIHSEIMRLKENIIIFIDAVDQLAHDDQFIWLPTDLPTNVKVIISALDDKNYKGDSRYFQALTARSSNIQEIPPFTDEDARKLIRKCLQNEGRKLQQHQEDYFIEQFNYSSTPLFVAVAAQNLKHWRSFDVYEGKEKSDEGITRHLPRGQQDLISDFIKNLCEQNHHKEELVNKVLGYLHASRDGLSESELLNLIDADPTFVNVVAPAPPHPKNTTKLPIVIWARLHTQIKPFIGKRRKDGDELLYLFHREFSDAVGKLNGQQNEHEAMITNTQEIILCNQNLEFKKNRWGKIYAALITGHYSFYKKRSLQKMNAEFIANLKSNEWKNSYVSFLLKKGSTYEILNKSRDSINYLESCKLTLSMLYNEDHEKWVSEYTDVLANLAHSYNSVSRTEEAISLEEERLKIIKKLYESDSDTWEEKYIEAIIYLSLSNYRLNIFTKEVDSLAEILPRLKSLYIENQIKWAKKFTRALGTLALFMKRIDQIKLAAHLERECYEELSKLYQLNKDQWIDDLINLKMNMAETHHLIGQPDIALHVDEECVELIEPRYQSSPARWGRRYTDALTNQATSLALFGRIDAAREIQEKAYEICLKSYGENDPRCIELANKVKISKKVQKQKREDSL
ncbi:Tetratricopeptide repeat-containing protein [Desulfuromusa kysingii]|uniref:Tetratricopeptide repeat-containing protein n=1 Tax=Desulfuromusa kysingii TaxID=37625 RepID=A0A1H3YZM6_9BACT|nr:AAA family ATPase [Desulfuromusa kysingii]SEA16877.1 Tetratricopeptide repeat-containing protein [Desulfuromusa kysingii]